MLNEIVAGSSHRSIRFDSKSPSRTSLSDALPACRRKVCPISRSGSIWSDGIDAKMRAGKVASLWGLASYQMSRAGAREKCLAGQGVSGKGVGGPGGGDGEDDIVTVIEWNNSLL